MPAWWDEDVFWYASFRVFTWLNELGISLKPQFIRFPSSWLQNLRKPSPINIIVLGHQDLNILREGKGAQTIRTQYHINQIMPKFSPYQTLILINHFDCVQSLTNVDIILILKLNFYIKFIFILLIFMFKKFLNDCFR